MGGTNAVAAVSACTRNFIQTITTGADSALGGSFALFFNGESTADLPYSASAGAIQAALEELGSVYQAQVSTSGAVDAQGGRTWTVTFVSTSRQEDAVESALFAEGYLLTGANARVLAQGVCPFGTLAGAEGANFVVNGWLRVAQRVTWGSCA